ncbi:MAG: hypothetical protein K9M44_04780, partial [Candidatus Pacebacteria bacterium]|nr:hypothetical protein [Candidatus Paceibacterota bacterium]
SSKPLKSEKTKKDSDDNNKDKQAVKGKEINDPSHLASRGGHDKVEGSSTKGSGRKMFRRKSG